MKNLQSNVKVGSDEITGTLKYVTGYTDFSSKLAQQSGNYLSLKVNVSPKDADVSVELIGGTKSSVKADPDGNFIIRITDKDTQKVKITASFGGKVETKVYKLNNLTLESAE